MRTIRCALPAVTALLLTTSSAFGQDEGYEVETDVISHEATQDIHVWHPGSGGGFPVVYALHGLGGTGVGWEVIAPALAERGVVVFATDYHSTDITQGRSDRIVADLECGYRYVREIAGDYGGDLTQPVLFVGHSLGAEMALGGGLDDMEFVPGGPYTACFNGADRPDAIVAIAGCYYEFEGQQFPFAASQYGSGDARTVLVGGEDDEVCAARQSRDATEALAASGREATYVEIAGATHATLIGHDIVDGEWLARPDHPTAAAVAGVILDVVASEQAAAG